MRAKIVQRVARLHRHGPRLRGLRPGAPPGSLDTATTGAPTPAEPARVSWFRYQEGGEMDERAGMAVRDCAAPTADASGVRWLHLQGSPTADQLEALGRLFGLHPLALEDVFNGEGRAKFETYEKQQFVVLNHIHRDPDGCLVADPISFFLGGNYLVSINEGPGDIFEPVRQRIRGNGPIRTRGADYLLYALMDVVVDSGFPVLEKFGDALEVLEDDVLEDPDREARNRIHYAKRELLLMRRAWWPQREVIAGLMRDDGRFFAETTRLYMRDCHGHCVIIMDLVETHREMVSSLLDTYLSAVSQRMNDIMKALTIIATIFLPLTFLTGLYGMNFDTASRWNMPELHWHFGYFYALGVMAAIATTMLVYFRRKGWW